jgi:hypothetical protein
VVSAVLADSLIPLRPRTQNEKHHHISLSRPHRPPAIMEAKSDPFSSSDGGVTIPIVQSSPITSSTGRSEREAELEQRLDLLQRQYDRLQRREEARQRDLRRQSIGIPSIATPLPTTSALTDPYYAPGQLALTATNQDLTALRSPLPRTRQPHRSVQLPIPDDAESEGDDNVDDVGHPTYQVTSDDEKKWEERIVRKAMTKLPAPEKFAGTSDADKAKVEQWCGRVTNYLNGLFHGVDARAQRMQFVLSLLEDPAARWMNSVYSEADDMSWEQLMPSFIDYVRGGQDQRAIWKQRMESLAFGRGKCRDLTSFDHEFDTLRMKLYPSSTSNVDMNIRSGEDYSSAIRRGDPQLLAEVLRILGPDRQQPTLNIWKRATATAVRIRDITREAARYPNEAGNRPMYARQPPSHAPSRVAAQNVTLDAQVPIKEATVETWEREEGEEDTVRLQLINAATPRRPGVAGQAQQNFLSEEERSRLLAAGKCFRCYGKGHRAKDPSCPGRGKPRRKPNAEDLKA